MLSAQAGVSDLSAVTFQSLEFSARQNGFGAPWVDARARGAWHGAAPRSALANQCLASPHGLRGSRALVLSQHYPALPRDFRVHVRFSGEQLASADGIYS